MKNKKLIATVASLCLVLVAVVAAVIGVLAAAQQQVTNKIKVGYIAVANVYATVSLNGKTEQTDYAENDESTNFISAEKTGSKELAFEYSTGLNLVESSTGLTNKYALYRFEFENQNSTHALEVTLKYVEGTAGTNVRLFWAKSSSDTWAPTLEYTAAGALITTAPLATDGFAVALNTDVKVYNHASGSVAAQIAESGTQYIYLVVAVVDLNANASYDLDGTTNSLLFTLDGYKAPAQGN